MLASTAVILSNFARNYSQIQPHVHAIGVSAPPGGGAFRHKPCGYSPRWTLVSALLLLIVGFPALAAEPEWMMTANGVVQDGQGNVYVVGSVTSDIVPVTPGAFQTKFNGGTCGNLQTDTGLGPPIPCEHGFAVKISADGSTILYATYIEGSQDDYVTPVGIDSTGNLFVLAGGSPGFPSTGSIAGLPPMGNTGSYFILELSSDGSSVLFSDAFSLPGNEGEAWVGINATALTSDGKLVFAGTTDGTAFPTTPEAYLSARPNAYLDGFVFKWDPKTNTIVHSTLIGGSNQDLLTSLTMDTSGNFYVAGYTVSPDFPLTPGAFYSPGTDSQGVNDFVAKLDANLSTLDFSLLFGGSYHPIPSSVAVDSAGNVYVDGSGSEDLPVSPGAFETSYSGGFLAKFDGKNGARIYFTYLGDGDGEPGSLATAADGSVWVAGINFYGGVVITPDAFEPSLPHYGREGYLKHISAHGSQQIYGTYLQELLALVDPGITVVTSSTNFFQINDFNVASPPPTGPLITIVNAASLSQPDYISPGEIVSIFGLSIGPTQPVSYQLNSTGDVPSNLNGLQVLINGVAAPILYASANQINAVVPFSAMNPPYAATSSLEVQNPAIAAGLSASTLWIVSSVPGIFESGGNGLILNQNATQNTSANPAKQGSIISLFVTGLGPMAPAPVDGSFATGTHSTPALPIQVFLGSGSETPYAPVNQNSITYAGDAPDEIEGLQQINVQLPIGTVYSSLYVKAGSGVSNAVAFFEQ
jgi:uncharacterized protein (TIGR03437 family)